MATREQLLAWRPPGVVGSYLASVILGELQRDGTDGQNALGQRATLESALDPLGRRECNTHLVVFVLDRVVLGIWPELGVYGAPGSSAGGGVSHGSGEGGRISAPERISWEYSVTPPGSLK
jgi:hypothetical protein